MLCISVAIVLAAYLLEIVLKYKLLKSFILSIKILNHFVTTLFNTISNYKSKAIKQYNLNFEQIFFWLGKSAKNY